MVSQGERPKDYRRRIRLNGHRRTIRELAHMVRELGPQDAAVIALKEVLECQ